MKNAGARGQLSHRLATKQRLEARHWPMRSFAGRGLVRHSGVLIELRRALQAGIRERPATCRPIAWEMPAPTDYGQNSPIVHKPAPRPNRAEGGVRPTGEIEEFGHF